MNRLRETPSQTVGPFFAYSLTAEQYGYAYNSLTNSALVGEQTPNEYAGAERIFITGRIFDGNGTTIPDAIMELWQADPLGRYRTQSIREKNGLKGFTGFGRVGTGTNAEHRFSFTTLKPGVDSPGVDAPGVVDSAPCINIMLFMRGSLRGLYTRLYFSDETEANAQDALLNTIPEERRHTLIAQRQEQHGQVFYEFDIYMQGEQETVFFAI